jgi:methyl-accepting chemotaxis protein
VNQNRQVWIAHGMVCAQLLPWWIARNSISFDLVSQVALGAVVLTVVLALASAQLNSRLLLVFRAIESGNLSASRENQLKSLEELKRLPIIQAMFLSAGWILMAADVSLNLWVNESPGAASLFWQVFLGAFLSFAYCLILASRNVLAASERVASHLDAKAVRFLAGPAPLSTRMRIATLIAFLVACPMFLLVDLALLHAPVEFALAELALCVLIGTLVMGEAAHLIVSPLAAIAKRARDGLFGKDAHSAIFAEGALWSLVKVYAEAELALGLSAERAKSASVSLSHVVQQVSNLVEDTNRNMTTQASALAQTSATTEELARTAEYIFESASAVTDLAKQTQQAAGDGQKSLGAFKAVVLRMRQDNEAIQTAVGRLSTRVQQIGKIVEFINSVAERCDLLALSAELEGTHAGDTGRAFTSVGNEMRRLAESVLESTAEVEELISEIQHAAMLTSQATRKSEAASGQSVALAFECTRTLDRIVEMANTTTEELEAIQRDTNSQKQSTHQLADAMSKILEETQGDMAIANAAGLTRDQLSRAANDLKLAVRPYVVPNGHLTSAGSTAMTTGRNIEVGGGIRGS